MPSTRRPTAFTVIELLITCAIIATICTLLLPAMQQARNQARETQCKNNLKQLGLAMHNYHDVHVVLPPAWIRKTPYAQSPSAWGWQVSILPYIEQAPLYDQLLRLDYPIDEGAFDQIERKTLQLELKVFRCPADTTTATNPMRGGWGTSNYSANFGSEPVPRLLPLTGSMYWPGAEATRTATNGIYWWNSSVRFRDVLDGTSATFMLGERCITSQAGIWPGVRSNSAETDAVTDTSPGNEINSGPNAFSSLHPGGTHFLMCDGAVRFINENIASLKPGIKPEEAVYQNLGNRADGFRIEF